MSGSESRPVPRTMAGHWVEEFRSFATLERPGSRAVESWFLGPRGENADVLERLVVEAVRDQVAWRKNYHPEDPVHITGAIKRSQDYQEGLDRLHEGYTGLLAFLKKSVPFFSMRYQGHMNWETTLPGILGYFAAMLYNPNNVAFQGSTATTLLEPLVGDDLCAMLGYGQPNEGVDAPRPWGHITCDGTVANIEAVWAARNLKYYPLSLRCALNDPSGDLSKVRDKITVRPAGSTESVPLAGLDNWQVLNLGADEILGLPAVIARALDLDETEGAAVVSAAIEPYLLQNIGYARMASLAEGDTQAPVILVPGTKHYSFSKAAAVLGIGAAQLLDVKVDLDARLDLNDLCSKLLDCAEKKRPVMVVVAVIGSTEEGSVDPLAGVLALRAELRLKGIDFLVHADAAFGGYHASIEREDDFDLKQPALMLAGPGSPVPPQLTGLSDYCRKQYSALAAADSITVDPHKSGYIPYPAGALCYRNSLMRGLVTFSAPVVYKGDTEPTVGIYGIEGSKPGAAVAAVYLSHRVIRPSKKGYGFILGRAMYSCKRLYARLLELGNTSEEFYVVPLPRIPASVPGKDDDARARTVIDSLSRLQDAPDPRFEPHLRAIGPDLNILAYAFNFRVSPGVVNQDLRLMNLFNEAISRELSLQPFEDIHGKDLIVSSTEIHRATYGDSFFEDFAQRVGLGEKLDQSLIVVLRSVVMDPWVTDLRLKAGGSGEARAGHEDFLDTIEEALLRAARAALRVVHPAVVRVHPSDVLRAGP